MPGGGVAKMAARHRTKLWAETWGRFFLGNAGEHGPPSCCCQKDYIHGMRALAAATKEEQRKSSSSRKKPGRVWLHSASSSDFGPAQWRAHRARKDPPCPCQCGRHTSATEPALQPNLPTNSLLLPLLVQASTAIQQSDASDTLLHRPHRIDSPPSIHVSSSRACPRGTRRLFSLPQPVRPANSPTESQGR